MANTGGATLKFNPLIAYEHYLASADGLCAIDRELRYVTWNDALARISGVPADEALGKKVFDLFPFLEAVGEREIHRRVFAGESVLADPRPFDVPEKNRRGYFQGLYSPWREKDGTIVGIFMSIRDVGASIDRLLSLRDLSTELSQVTTMQKAFDTTLAFLTRVTGAKRGLIVLFSEDKRNLVLQSEIRMSHAVKKQENVPMDLIMPITLAAKSGQPILVSTLEESAHFDERYLRYLKKTGDVAAGALPLIVEGETIGSLALTYDCEHLFSAEEVHYLLAASNLCAQSYARARQFESEKSARAKAEEADRAKSRFLANVSHELRTPMTAIVGFAELIQNNFELAAFSGDLLRIEKLKGFAGNILKHSLSFKKILDDILDLTRIESGRFHIEREVVLLKPWMDDIAQIARQLAASKPISVELVIEENAPHALWTDPHRSKQILLNLLSNAVKFTDSGRILFRVSSRRTGKIGGRVASIVVQDTGIGMKQMSNVFEPIDSNARREDRRGSGLGLAIAQRLAHALGGEMQLLKSEPNVGTAFELLLPIDELNEESSHTERANQSPARMASIGHVQNKTLSGTVILIADDEADVLQYLAETLKSAGAEVIATHDGAEAIEQALMNHVDLFILDLQMPRIDGLEAAKQLRESGFDQPLLALTAHGLPEYQIAAQRAGFEHFLIKPVDLSVLAETILSIRK